MELYDKKYVYFDWDDVLEGEKGFFSNSISELKRHVEDNKIMYYGEIRKDTTVNTDFPFEFTDDDGYTHLVKFCYYDPFYEIKRAYNEGKQIQYKAVDTGEWRDCFGYPSFFPNSEYRIKPDCYEVYTSDLNCLRICSEDDKPSKEHWHCFFEGTYNECKEWVMEHEKFYDVMCYWEQGKTIEAMGPDSDWHQVATPNWHTNHKYRVKDNRKEYAPFDTLDELIHKWEGMNPGCTNRPACAMPMMWVKRKRDNTIHLVVNYYPDGIGPRHSDVGTDDEHLTLKELFEDYTFINDSIIGKRADKE